MGQSEFVIEWLDSLSICAGLSHGWGHSVIFFRTTSIGSLFSKRFLGATYRKVRVQPSRFKKLSMLSGELIITISA